MSKTKECQQCGKKFPKPPKYSQKQWENAKYCSNECDGKSKRNGKTVECEYCGGKFYTQPSVKQKYCSSSCFAKDRPKEEHSRWKESGVGMPALHEWVEKELGKPDNCEHCDRDNAARYEWANKSGEYKRDTDDWIRLCSVCHKAYDGMTLFTKEQAERIRATYNQEDITYSEIAEKHSVSETTIANIVKKETKYYA